MRAAAIQTHSRNRWATYTSTAFDVCSKIENKLTLGRNTRNTRKCEVAPGIFGIGVCDMNVNYVHERRPVCSDTWELLSSQSNQALFILDEYETSVRWILLILVNRIEKCSLTQIKFFGPRIGLDRVWMQQCEIFCSAILVSAIEKKKKRLRSSRVIQF